MRGDRRPLPGVAAAALAVAWSAAPAAAQDGGLSADLSFAQRIVSTDGDVTGETALGFDLRSDTRRQYFNFSADGTLEARFEGDAEAEFVDPTLRLGYGIDARQTSLSFDLAYTERDVDSIFELDALPGIFVIDSGTRSIGRAGLNVEFGREAPFGGTVELDYVATTYTDTTDPSLLDSSEGSVDLSFRFDIDRRISARVFAGYSELDRDGGVDVTRERLGLGADLAVTQTLSADVSLGVTRVTEDDAGTESVDEGLSFALSLTEERPNGSWTAALNSDIDESGRRSTATIGRTYELREASFSAEFGLSEGSDEELRPLYALSFSQDLPSGQIGVSLDQSFATNSGGFETLNTRLDVDWRRELTRVSSLGAGIGLRDTDVLGGPGDAQRLDLSLSYSHDLTEDWALIGGVTHSVEREEGSPDDRSNEVFVGLQTTVGWRP